MNKKTLGLTLMVLFFFISTALFLATFSGSKDTRSRAATEYGIFYGRVSPTSGVRPIISKPPTPGPTRYISPTRGPTRYMTPTPRITKTPTPTPAPVGTITLDRTSVSLVLHRSNAIGGLVYGPGFTITSQGANAWQIKYNEPTQGQGFYESSGGIVSGYSATIRSYINTNKPNGVYTGSAIVQYAVNGIWYDGPTVKYSITLQ